MWKSFINWLKWKIAAKEMAELERCRSVYQFHYRWLAEFPNIASVIRRMEKESFSGIESTSGIYSFREDIRKSNTK